MSKHNNNLSSSSSRRCRCGRYITLGEERAGIGVFSYECPECLYRRYSKYYQERKFNLK